MKINPIYRSLLDKSIASMLAAIEIYNKPNFQYREDTFAILAVNAWELLLKAYLFKLNKYHRKSIYELEPAKKKDGTKGKHKQIAKNGKSKLLYKHRADKSIFEFKDNVPMIESVSDTIHT